MSWNKHIIMRFKSNERPKIKENKAIADFSDHLIDLYSELELTIIG